MLKQILILAVIVIVIKKIFDYFTKPFLQFDLNNISQEFKTGHNGIDIPLPENSPLYAPITGELSTNYTVSGGNQAFIKNKHYRYGFSHLNDVSNYDNVIKGQKFALSGNTGITTGAHVHLTVFDYSTNEFINPIEHFNN